jgi:ABC-2 type transport system permease protein
MRAALRLAGKDLRQRLRDRSAVLVAVVVPLVLASVFSLVFGSGFTPRPFEYAVVDLDRGAVADSFRERLLAPLAQEKIISVRAVGTVAEAERLAEAGEVDAAFVLPAGLTAAASRGAVPGGAAPGGGVPGGTPGGAGGIDVVGSVDSPTGSDVAHAIADAFVSELNSVRVAAAAALGDDAGQAALSEAAGRATALTAPVTVEDISARRKILDAKTFFAASMAVFFLFFTVQFGLSSLVDERAGGTLNRLLALPIRPGAVLGGKLLTSVVLGVVSMAVLVLATNLLLGADWGDPLAVAALVVSGVLAATGVTAVVASLARTPEQASSWQAVVATLLGLLGGAFFPVGQVGGALAALSLATPHAWFLRGLAELAGGGGLTDVLPAIGAMLAFGGVFGGLALIRLRRMVQP